MRRVLITGGPFDFAALGRQPSRNFVRDSLHPSAVFGIVMRNDQQTHSGPIQRDQGLCERVTYTLAFTSRMLRGVSASSRTIRRFIRPAKGASIAEPIHGILDST